MLHCVAWSVCCSSEGQRERDSVLVPTTPELCDSQDNDHDGLTDEGYPVGSACVGQLGACHRWVGTYECATPVSVRCSSDPEGSGSPAAPEACNGLDDDCDGDVDEDLSRSCSLADGGGVQLCANGAWQPCAPDVPNPACDAREDLGEPCLGEGACGAGRLECSPEGALVCSTMPGASEDASREELCDGLDNDCDGATDEGFLVSDHCLGRNGECAGEEGRVECADLRTTRCSTDAGGSTTVARDELCDGLDNDCDGETDEGFGIGAPCDGLGLCFGGQLECEGPEATRCSSAPGGSEAGNRPEVCNGLDDDCDGLIDEEPPGLGEPCRGRAGPCAAIDGVMECSPSGGVVCSVELGGSACPAEAERCDGLDNDCDGVVDEAVFAPCLLLLGAEGEQRCQDGEWLPCGWPRDREALCDGRDNDGDGATDEGFGLGIPCVGVGVCGDGAVECDGEDATRCSSMPAGSADVSSEEVCDGLDNDCDGETDEGVLLEFFRDGDEDGHGDPAIGSWGCAPEEGWTSLSDDCDDQQVDSFPGNVEVCDGLDNDCDGVVDEGEICPDDTVGPVDELTQRVYLVANREFGAGNKEIVVIWPPTDPLESLGGYTSRHQSFSVSPDGEYLYAYYDYVPDEYQRRPISGSVWETVFGTDYFSTGMDFGVSGAGYLLGRIGYGVWRYPENVVILDGRPGLTLAGVGRDGRFLVVEETGPAGAAVFVAYDAQGREYGRADLHGAVDGEILADPTSATSAGNRFYFLYARMDGFRVAGLLSYRLDEDGTWARQRRIGAEPLQSCTRAIYICAFKVLSDGTILVQEEDPLAEDKGRVRALLPDGREQIAWRDADGNGYDTWDGLPSRYGMFVGPRPEESP